MSGLRAFAPRGAEAGEHRTELRAEPREHPLPEPVKPAPRDALALFEQQFERGPLSRLLGTDDEASLALARSATRAPLAQVLARSGKGLRARLVVHAHALAREAMRGRARPLPSALPGLLELLHAGSLIVDDVEDDATLRRGAPALHRLIGAPLAINAGNFLYFLPILALEGLELDDAIALAMHRRIARSLTRCHHGQALDLSLRACELGRAELARAVELSTTLKTGALMELACALGAIAAGAPPPVEEALARFGCEAGVALQMLDDLSGFLNPSRREKALEDLLQQRPTWAWALGAAEVGDATLASWQRLGQSAARGDRACAEALLGQMAPHLQPLRARPRARLDAALVDLRGGIGDLPALAPLAQELGALEQGYV